eukprot:6214709-Pleurochrysis_carterae.AAC.1
MGTSLNLAVLAVELVTQDLCRLWNPAPYYFLCAEKAQMNECKLRRGARGRLCALRTNVVVLRPQQFSLYAVAYSPHVFSATARELVEVGKRSYWPAAAAKLALLTRKSLENIVTCREYMPKLRHTGVIWAICDGKSASFLDAQA